MFVSRTSRTPGTLSTISTNGSCAYARSKTSVTSEMRSMKTNDRILRNESCSACSTDRKNTDALVTDVDTSQST